MDVGGGRRKASGTGIALRIGVLKSDLARVTGSYRDLGEL